MPLLLVSVAAKVEIHTIRCSNDSCTFSPLLLRNKASVDGRLMALLIKDPVTLYVVIALYSRFLASQFDKQHTRQYCELVKLPKIQL